MHYVYLLESTSAAGQRYVGATEDLKARLAQHNAGGSPHTSKHRPWKLVEHAFEHVRTTALKEGLGVHFPLIGCGLARGEWSEVAPRIERALGPDVDKHLWLLPDQPEPQWT